ncbi:hypothetical protein [Nocardiopsis alba]|uniref:hypothetical protein n=1 Tax=Nocardiopsis alba TaxID=53437 RepID=UPI0033D30B4D
MTIINTTQAGPDGEEPALLEYRLFTDPHPIRVSPQGAEEGENPEIDPARAQLMFVASNNGRDPVRLRKLSVEIPTGELAAQLALSLERAESTISLKGWTASRSGEVIEFTTTDPYTEIAPGQGLTFQISEIPVNHEVGAVELRITEGYEGTGRGSLSIFTGKFPQDFYLDGFSADKYEIDNGGKVILTWKRSEGVTTTLLYGGNPPEDVTGQERKEIKDLKTTTTFYLIGQVGDVQIMRSVLVTVLNPDLVVNKLTVNDTLDAKGDVVIANGKKLKTNDIAGNGSRIEVHNTIAQLEGLIRTGPEGIEVNGPLDVGGYLTVDPSNDAHGTGPGRFQVGNLIVRPGDVLLKDGIRVTGELEAQGGATVKKSLSLDSMSEGTSLMGSKHNLTARHPFSGMNEGTMHKYRANTDGYVYATIRAESHGTVARANIYNLSNSLTVGALVDPASNSPDRSSAVIGLKKGQEFGLTRAIWRGSVYIYFRWVSIGPGAPAPSSLGTGSVSAEEFTEIAETDFSSAPKDAPIAEGVMADG